MTNFSDEEYLRALADNGDQWAQEHYEEALENRIKQLQIALEKVQDKQEREELQRQLNQAKEKKRDYFNGKKEKEVNELNRRQEEETRVSREPLTDKWNIKWIAVSVALALTVIAVMTLLWYSNNQNENETNPWKNGQIGQTQGANAGGATASSNQVDTSSLSDDQLQDWILSTYAAAQGGSGEDYKNLQWKTYSWTDEDGLVYAQLYDSYGNDVLLFRVDEDGQLEAFGGIDGTSGSWDVVAKSYSAS